MSDIVKVSCPKCKKSFFWDLDNPTENPHRPFCSATCKNSDFLAWANGEYKVSRTMTQDEEEISQFQDDEGANDKFDSQFSISSLSKLQ